MIDEIFNSIQNDSFSKKDYINYYNKIYNITNISSQQETQNIKELIEKNIKKIIFEENVLCDKFNYKNSTEYVRKFPKLYLDVYKQKRAILKSINKMFLYFCKINKYDLTNIFNNYWREVIVKNIEYFASSIEDYYDKNLNLFVNNDELQEEHKLFTSLIENVKIFNTLIITNMFENIFLKKIRKKLVSLVDIQQIIKFTKIVLNFANYNFSDLKNDIINLIKSILQVKHDEINSFYIEELQEFGTTLTNIFSEKSYENLSTKYFESSIFIINKYLQVFMFSNYLEYKSVEPLLNIFYSPDIFEMLKSCKIDIVIKYIQFCKNIYNRFIETHDFKDYISKNDRDNLIIDKDKIIESVSQIIENLTSFVCKDINNELLSEIIKNIYNPDYEYKYGIKILLKSLKNKDEFLVMYKNALTKRLILEKKPICLDNENYISSIFINDENFEAISETSHVSILLQDYELSKNLSYDFNNKFKLDLYNEENLFNDRMLHIKNINQNDNIKIFRNIICLKDHKEPELQYHSNIFKKSLQHFKENYTNYYTNKNKSRILNWKDSLSSCVLTYDNIDITCSYQQADLFHMFNDNDSLNYNDITMYKELVDTLIKVKLIKNKNGILSFRKPKNNINLLKYSKNPNKPKTENVTNIQQKQIQYNREDIIDAFIMRFLKINSKSNSNTILTELKKKCKHMFEIEKTMYDKRLKKLIEKEYIEEKDEELIYVP